MDNDEIPGGMYAVPTRKLARLREYSYSEPGYYFIAICTQNKRSVFADHQIRLTPAGEIATRGMADLPSHCPDILVDMFCVMPDHIHAILQVSLHSVGAAYMPPTPRYKERLIRAVQQYKAAVTRLTGVKPLWQRGYYDHIIRNDMDLNETRRYIQNNPAKWLEIKD